MTESDEKRLGNQAIRGQGEGVEQLEAEFRDGTRVSAGFFAEDTADRGAACPAFLAGRKRHVSPAGRRKRAVRVGIVSEFACPESKRKAERGIWKISHSCLPSRSNLSPPACPMFHMGHPAGAEGIPEGQIRQRIILIPKS